MTERDSPNDENQNGKVNLRFEKLRLDYEQTAGYFHELAGVRFKLLAFLPIVTGSAIIVLDQSIFEDPRRVLPIGLLGFLATLGIMFYDQRNTELYDRMQVRAKLIEAFLQFESFDKEKKEEEEEKKEKEGEEKKKGEEEEEKKEKEKEEEEKKKCGGAFIDRPRRRRKLFGIIPMWHDLGLTIVYAATMGGWTYLISDSLTSSPKQTNSPWHSAIVTGVPAFIACLFYAGLILLDDPTDEQGALPPHVRKMIWKNPKTQQRIHREKRDTKILNRIHAIAVLVIGVAILISACMGARNGTLTALTVASGAAIGAAPGAFLLVMFALWKRVRGDDDPGLGHSTNNDE